MKLMKRLLGILLALAVLAVGILYWQGTRDDASTGPTEAPADPQQRIERGRYLALAGNCMACHTARGGQAYAGGTAIPTPFGTIYGPNITPDEKTGIGAWSADDFGRRCTTASRATARCCIRPSRTPNTPASRVPTRMPCSPICVRSRRSNGRAARRNSISRTTSASCWRRGAPCTSALACRRPIRASRPSGTADATWSRAWATAPLAMRRATAWARRATDGLAGGIIPMLDWYAPPLTNDPQTGLGRWSAEDIAALLRTGIAAHSSASGPMAEVVLGSTQHLSDADALAMGVYLKSLPSTPAPAAVASAAVAPAAMELGGKIYRQQCAQCHQPAGEGSAGAWPALAGNPTVTAPSPLNAIRMVLDGGFAPATAANPRPHGMPPFGQLLNDNDVAMLVSYIRNSWGNQAGA